MNILQLVLKQMRQRALSTVLTCLSIVLGVGLAIAILIVAREGRSVFAQTDYGFDLLVGPKASPLQLVMNSIYHVDMSPGNIPYKMYTQMAGIDRGTAEDPNPFRGLVSWAVPYAVGDSYQGRRIIGTTPAWFGMDDEGNPLPDNKRPSFRGSETLSLAEGKVFAPRKFEAVIGSEVAKRTDLKLGSTFHATHGVPGPNDVPDIHDEVWTVVGVMNETHTANDKCLFIPLVSFYSIFEHSEGLQAISDLKAVAAGKAAPASAPASVPATKPAGDDDKGYTLDAQGNITTKLPVSEWEISAILVKSRSAATGLQLQFLLRNLPDAVGVNPATVMGQFFDEFMGSTVTLLLVISALVTIVAAISILVSIYNSVTGRRKEIAIMRALGATRNRILTIVCVEAGVIGIVGGIIGLAVGHGVAAAGSIYLMETLGSGIPWWKIGSEEWLYCGAVVIIAVVAGLVPALKAYTTPVAENLASS